MYNPRFPHTLVVKRVHKDNGEITYDTDGNPQYDVVALAVVDTLDGNPVFNADGTMATTSANSISFGYRGSSRSTKETGDVVVSDYKIATPMFLTELYDDDVLVITDYDRTFKGRLVRKVTTNFGSNIWFDEVKN